MANPFARILAQVVVATAGILTRAVVAAYSQAVQNAQAGTRETAKAMTRKSKVSIQEALQILNLQKSEMKPDLIQKRYSNYFEINNPDKGGSFYLQSKVFRAKEALEEQLNLLAKQAKEDSFLRKERTSGSASTSTSTSASTDEEGVGVKGTGPTARKAYTRRTGPRPS